MVDLAETTQVVFTHSVANPVHPHADQQFAIMYQLVCKYGSISADADLPAFYMCPLT